MGFHFFIRKTLHSRAAQSAVCEGHDDHPARPRIVHTCLIAKKPSFIIKIPSQQISFDGIPSRIIPYRVQLVYSDEAGATGHKVSVATLLLMNWSAHLPVHRVEPKDGS